MQSDWLTKSLFHLVKYSYLSNAFFWSQNHNVINMLMISKSDDTHEGLVMGSKPYNLLCNLPNKNRKEKSTSQILLAKIPKHKQIKWM